MSTCPPYAPFFGFAGVASAMIFSTVGAAFGTSKAGIGIAGLGGFKPELIMRSLIPVVMSGIIAVYGLVVSVLIAGSLSPSQDYPLFSGFVHLGAGLACGITGMTAGYAIGIVGDSCVRAYVHESKVFVSMVLILIFSEVLGLYGLIVALIMNSRAIDTMGDVDSLRNDVMDNSTYGSKYPPLITPSASPPTTAYPPSKRPRLAETPSSSSSVHPTTSQSDPNFEFESARRESSLRVLNAWSQIAERYQRKFDKDDVVDLASWSIIKDRGFLRNEPQRHRFGFLTGADANDTGSEGAGAQTEGEDDDLDELDALAPEADISDELEKRQIPPVRVQDPVAEEDLRQFLEDERERKAMYGDEEEDGSSVDDFALSGSFLEDGVIESDFDEEDDEEEEDDVEEGEEEGEDIGENKIDDPNYQEVFTDLEEGLNDVDDRNRGNDHPHVPNLKNGTAQVASASRQSVSAFDDESDDELAAWGMNEGSIVYQISNDMIVFDPSPPPPPAHPPRGRSQSRKPEKTRTPLTSKSKGRSRSKSKGTRSSTAGTNQWSPSPPPVTQLLQLQTPPRSSASLAHTPDSINRHSVVDPPLSLPLEGKVRVQKKAGPKPRPLFVKGERRTTRGSSASPADPLTVFALELAPTPAPVSPKPVPATPETPIPSLDLSKIQLGKAKVTVKKKPAPKPVGRKFGKPRLRPEVVIVQKPKWKSTKPPPKDQTAPPDPDIPVPKPDIPPALPAPQEEVCFSKKGKGKAREKDVPLSVLISSVERDDLDTTTCASPAVSETASQIGKKRKRVPSLALPLEGARQEDREVSPLPPAGVVSPTTRSYSVLPSSRSPGPSSPQSSSRLRQHKSHDSISSVASISSQDLGTNHVQATTSYRSQQNRYRSHSHVPSVPPDLSSPYPYLMYPYPQPPTFPPERETAGNTHPQNSHRPHPQPYSMQAPQAQLLIAQAMHHLSYLLTATGLPGPSVNRPPAAHDPYYPPPFSLPTWPPYIPHARHPGEQGDFLPSTSTSSPVYSTPTHPHPHPYAHNPAFSGSTLPPSSPPPSSPVVVETRTRSKSRGRRVSFKLDAAGERPRSSSPKDRREKTKGMGEDPRASNVATSAGNESSTADESMLHRTSGRVSSRSAKRKVSVSPPRTLERKGKGKARARSREQFDGKGEVAAERSNRFERGQTPGPPSMPPSSSPSPVEFYMHKK